MIAYCDNRALETAHPDRIELKSKRVAPRLARQRICTALLLLGLCASHAFAAEQLSSVGSDTFGSLMLRWTIAFQALHPDTRMQLQTPGSASAPLALSAGAAQIGPMSRAMTDIEEQQFVASYGYPPQHVRVALDAIAVIVHLDNPLNSISLEQLDDAYSQTRLCGGTREIETWASLGVGGPLANRPLLRIGRNTASGSYEYFRATALCNGDYQPRVVQFPGAGAIVAAVASQTAAIGYSGISHINGLVKTLQVSMTNKDVPIAADRVSMRSGRYPLTRPLYIYFNQRPDEPHRDLAHRFLRFALSDAGQALVEAEGLVPLDAADLSVQRRTLD